MSCLIIWPLSPPSSHLKPLDGLLEDLIKRWMVPILYLWFGRHYDIGNSWDKFHDGEKSWEIFMSREDLDNGSCFGMEADC